MTLDEFRVEMDALALIDNLKIVAAIPAFRALAERLGQSAERSESFWIERANQLADDLQK